MNCLLKNTQLKRAIHSLEGLSVGDAFGNLFFIKPDVVDELIVKRSLPVKPWPYTDDTEMAMSIVSILRQYGYIEQNALAKSFARHYNRQRGYGPAIHRILGAILNGEDWAESAQSLFGGQGSFGNGAAMRVAPLGAFFADELDVVVEQAAKSSIITHTHNEAIAGAIAVAVAAAQAWQLRNSSVQHDRAEFLDRLLPSIPESEVKSKVRRARDMSPDASVKFAVSVLGNGIGLSAQDTVPFALWCAATYLNNYEEALWLTVSGLGDRDTTCAIVGGIVVLYTGVEGIPQKWRKAREILPSWAFNEWIPD
ncbi:MAG TPA: ADP-ribosylglycohydrolase family protein [Cytophagaceae bacterium]|jgi:ADP-ribosylglycohydrolase